MAEQLGKIIIPVWHSGAYPPADIRILIPGLNYVSSGGKPLVSGRFDVAMAQLLCALCAKGLCPASLDTSPVARVGPAAPAPASIPITLRQRREACVY